ncbi:MAG: DUF4389 domain-containing protein [Gammaproteobacteria bacterium]|nr:DUF4389 domain-containing protein [Gammaproteobacteria bacterium]
MSDDSVPADHVVTDENGDGGNAAPIEEHLKSKSTWLRLVFMIIFYVLASVATLVASVVVALGFLWVLFTGETNDQLRRTGQGIASYVYQIIQYLTYNSEEKPFPFDAEWPAPKADLDVDDSDK